VRNTGFRTLMSVAACVATGLVLAAHGCSQNQESGNQDAWERGDDIGGDRGEDNPITSPHGLGLALPGEGQLYHGVFPGTGESGMEDSITKDLVDAYENAVGKPVAWVYFSHDWFNGEEFPWDKVSWIKERGAVPFIRLFPVSSEEQNTAEPHYTLEAIAAGDFDDVLIAWAQEAIKFDSPLIVEFGTEVNGEWFTWNGVWHGGEDGPAVFRAAYRHIVRVTSDEGASQITWVFHVNNDSVPNEDWNSIAEYYPGDDAVDWVGTSAYGAQTPMADEWPVFAQMVDSVSLVLAEVAPGKPQFVFEFGVTSNNPLGNPVQWADEALAPLIGGRWPEIKGFSWWNEAWENDEDPAHDTDMRVQSVPGMAKVFHDRLGSDAVIGRPLLDE